MNPSQSSRIRRSLYVIISVMAVVCPPLLVPELREVYAPLHDGVFLWLIGNVWYRFMPLSPIILIPVAFMLLGLWLAWILQTRFLNRLQLGFTATFVRMFPGGGIYRKFKVVQAYWIYVHARLPERYRKRFPLNLTPECYDLSCVSPYYLTVTESLRDQWYDTYRLQNDHTPSQNLVRLIVESSAGDAGLYVPSVKCTEIIASENFAKAITSLDNAQVYGASHWVVIQELFRIYVDKQTGLDVTRMTPRRVSDLLEGENALDKTILLRILINLWVETRHPPVGAIVTAYLGTHFRRVYRLFHVILNRHHDDITSFEPDQIPHIHMRNFQRRYLYFLEQARGNAAVINTRNLLDDLSHKANQVHSLLSGGERDAFLTMLFHTHPDLEPQALSLADEWTDLLHAGDHHLQADALKAQSSVLQTHRQPIDDARWSVLYRTGRIEAYEEEAVEEQTSHGAKTSV